MGRDTRLTVASWLLALILATTLPLAALVAHLIHERSEADLAAARAQVHASAESAAFEAAQFVARVERLLLAVARDPDVGSLDARRCPAHLRDLKDTVPESENLLTLDADGALVCSVLEAAPGGTDKVDPRDYLDRLRQTRAFTIGRPALGFVSHRWVVTLAQPVPGEAGKLRGVAAMAVDLEHFSGSRMPLRKLPDGAVTGIIDSTGTIIHRSPDAATWIGKQSPLLAPTGTAWGQGADGVVQASGADGVQRVYAFSRVAGTGWTAYVGIEREAALAPARRQALWSGGLATIVLLLAALFAYLAARRIARPVKALTAAVRKAAEGDIDADMDVHGPREMAEVAGEFNALLARRRQDEQRLQEAQQRYEELLRSSPHGVAVADGGRLVYMNPTLEHLLGMSCEQAQSVDLLQQIAPVDRQRMVAWRERRGTSDSFAAQGRMRWLRPDGAERRVEVTASTVMWHGRLMHMYICQDVTEQEALAQQVREGRKDVALARMTAGVAHDFNNLLGIVIGNLDEASAPGVAQPGAGAHVLAAREAALRAAGIVRELMTVASQQSLHRSRHDINALVDRRLPSLLAMAGGAIQVSLALHPHPLEASVDPDRFWDVLAALVMNAKEAMPGAPHVARIAIRTYDEDRPASRVDGLEAGHYAVVEIEDNGKGMSEVVREHAFDPFFSTKERGRSTGLGLSVAHGYARQLGGGVLIDTREGQGTIVRLYFPALRHDPAGPLTGPGGLTIVGDA